MKILAIGKNYVSDQSEIALAKPEHPIIFSKPASSLVLDNENVPFPKFTEDLRYEVELVIQIGKDGKNIKKEAAESHIGGIGIGIDFTAKDVLSRVREGKGPWDLAKGFDGGAPVSNFIPIIEFQDLTNINFGLSINDEKVQQGNTSLLITTFEEMISYISQYMTLQKGDLLFTGTPASGTGQSHSGDHLVATIEGNEMLNFSII